MKRWEAHDWNQYAFFLVLRAIHGRMHGFRPSFDLYTLVDVAQVVDYYQCSDAASLLVAGTIDSYPDPWSNSPTQERILGIFIFFAFSMASEFEYATGNCIRHSLGVISNEDVPLPDEIVGMYWRSMQVNGLLFVQDTDSGR